MTRSALVFSIPPPPPPRWAVLVAVFQAILCTVIWVAAPAAHTSHYRRDANQAEGLWTPPVSNAKPSDLLRPFVAPKLPWSAAHRGVDIEARAPEVLAPASGEIIFTGHVVDRPVVTIQHSNGMLSSLEPVETDLEVGDIVAQGDRLGVVSPDTQHCIVECVHWGVRVPDGWRVGAGYRDLYIDPGLLLGWTKPSILWPIRAAPST